MGKLSANEIGRYAVVLMWVAINIGLFSFTYWNYGITKKYTYLRKVVKTGLPFARGAASCLNFNCMLILMTMCRNIISLIRSTLNHGSCGIFIRFLDKSITFHKYIAYAICFFTIVHVGAHCFNFEQLCHSWGKASVMDHRLSQLSGDKHWVNPIRRANADTVTEALKSVPGLTGIVITLSLILMVSSATELIRWSYFEVFWFTHHLFVVFFIGLVAHGMGGVLRYQTEESMAIHNPTFCVKNITMWSVSYSGCHQLPEFEAPGATTWKWVVAPVILYVAERCLRFYRSMQKIKIIKVVKHPSRVIEIQMKKKGFKSEAGQYIFLQCSKISQLEWHPFTLTSAPEEDYFSVHIRTAGDWTEALAKECERVNSVDELPRLAVDGPFGTASTDIFKYDVVLLVGAGIGVTPFASVLKSLWYRLNDTTKELKVKKVYFSWICRDTFAFEWFTDLLKHLEVQMAATNTTGIIEYNIFLTRFDPAKMAIHHVIHGEDSEADIITGLGWKTQYGRPNFNKIFKETADKHANTDIGVFFCGPAGLSHTLHMMSNEYSDESKGVKFFYNKENF